jgi:branched-chain amino acid transport system permease protein
MAQTEPADLDLLVRGKTGVAVAARKGPLARLFDWVESPAGRRIVIPLILALALAFPLICKAVGWSDGNVDRFTFAFAFAILALGLNVVVGFAGLLDLGYAAFFAIGAYSFGVFASYQVQPEWSSFWEPFRWLGLVEQTGDRVHFTVSFWLMIPLAAIIAALFGVAFGAPTLRLKGDYLAIVTLGFGEIIPIVARNTPYLTNGSAGLNGVATPNFFGFNFGISTWPYYYLALILLAGMIIFSARLKDSRVGRAWLAIREDEIAAEAMGVNRTRLKLLAFAIGAAFAGASGTFYVSKLQVATPEMFVFAVSITLLVMIVLGGMGSVAGVVLGALLVQLLQTIALPWLGDQIKWFGGATHIGLIQRFDITTCNELIFGFILVLMMLFRRQGLIPERRTVTALSHAEQTAVPTRGGMGDKLAQLHQRTVDTSKPLLDIKGLTKSFGGIRAVRSIDLEVKPGAIVAVIGPNGSGKTTLFNLITGLTRPDGGKILVAGEDVTGLSPDRVVKRGIARTFQNLRVFNNLSLLENVLIGTHVQTKTGVVGAVLRTPAARREEVTARQKVMDTLQIFGNRLIPRRFHLARTLSYANRRRLEIARALMTEPVLLLLDEPTAGMNQTETLELADQIRGLRDRGVSILMIEHKLNVVNDIADKVIVLDHGEKIAEGLPVEIHSNKEVLRAYLGRSADAVAADAAAKAAAKTAAS